jgi:hypothetical protein
MTIHDATNDLLSHLQGVPWLTGAGLGERDGPPCIVLYVTSLKPAHSFLPDVWQGYPLELKKMGKLRPLRKPLAG